MSGCRYILVTQCVCRSQDSFWSVVVFFFFLSQWTCGGQTQASSLQGEHIFPLSYPPSLTLSFELTSCSRCPPRSSFLSLRGLQEHVAVPRFLCGCWRSKLCRHVYAASISLSEPSPQSLQPGFTEHLRRARYCPSPLDIFTVDSILRSGLYFSCFIDGKLRLSRTGWSHVIYFLIHPCL